MQLDSRVKVIALSFLSVLVDAYLSQRLRAGKRKEKRMLRIRGDCTCNVKLYTECPMGWKKC